MKSKKNLIYVIQLCGRKKGMLYITVTELVKRKLECKYLYIIPANFAGLG